MVNYERFPYKFVQQVACEIGVSQDFVKALMVKRNTPVYAINEDDPDRRVRFCE